MKVVYDREVNVLSVLLSDATVAESDQDKPGVILDYDGDGNIVSFEILDASKRMANPMSVEYAVTTPLRRPTRWSSMREFDGHVALREHRADGGGKWPTRKRRPASSANPAGATQGRDVSSALAISRFDRPCV